RVSPPRGPACTAIPAGLSMISISPSRCSTRCVRSRAGGRAAGLRRGGGRVDLRGPSIGEGIAYSGPRHLAALPPRRAGVGWAAPESHPRQERLPRSLPIDPLLPRLVAALAAAPSAVLQAPPGAGKTTRVPLALAEADWIGGGKVVVLEPRRLPARMAARHM